MAVAACDSCLTPSPSWLQGGVPALQTRVHGGENPSQGCRSSGQGCAAVTKLRVTAGLAQRRDNKAESKAGKFHREIPQVGWISGRLRDQVLQQAWMGRKNGPDLIFLQHWIGTTMFWGTTMPWGPQTQRHHTAAQPMPFLADVGHTGPLSWLWDMGCSHHLCPCAWHKWSRMAASQAPFNPLVPQTPSLFWAMPSILLLSFCRSLGTHHGAVLLTAPCCSCREISYHFPPHLTQPQPLPPRRLPVFCLAGSQLPGKKREPLTFLPLWGTPTYMYSPCSVLRELVWG